MGYFSEVDPGPDFPPFVALRESCGFVPNAFRSQTAALNSIAAQTALVRAVVQAEGALSRARKEYILLRVAALDRNPYCLAGQAQNLRMLGEAEQRIAQVIKDFEQADIPAEDKALLAFAATLFQWGPYLAKGDFAGPFSHGFTDEAMLEAVLATALGAFQCALARGLGVDPDFEPPAVPVGTMSEAPSRAEATEAGPYLRSIERRPEEFAPFAFFRDVFGFVPNLFRAQTLRPDVVEAEAAAIRDILLAEDLLTRIQKEYILLAISAANLNTYCVAVHCGMLRALGINEEDCDQIAADHRSSRLSDPDKALLDFALKLAAKPSKFGAADVETLREHGFSDSQMVEGVVMAALTTFLNTLQMGLGVAPDFEPRRFFRIPEKSLHLSGAGPRPTVEVTDPDAEWVERVQKGDLDAFEALVQRHNRRVYRTLVGLLGDPDQARDAVQDTFLKAFQNLNRFEGRSKFSTWLVSIATNTGLQILRDRRNEESLDTDESGEERFRPRQVRAWTDDPEQLYSKSEIRTLVQQNIMRLPAKYRVVLVLRDLEQLSTGDAAAALGLGIPALKARLLRGRLMLREALAPHFIRGAQEVRR